MQATSTVFFVHGVDELLHVEAAVGPGRDLRNVKAAVPQRADGQLNARVFKAGGNDFVPQACRGSAAPRMARLLLSLPQAVK